MPPETPPPYSLYNPHRKQPDRLVENRTVIHTAQLELNLFETFEQAQSVVLRFDSAVFVSMISGKKLIRLGEASHVFPLLPQEAFMLPSGRSMSIDFPEASPTQPTRCIALAISDELVQHTLRKLTCYQTDYPHESILVSHTHAPIIRAADIQTTISRLVHLLTQPSVSKLDCALADTLAEELLLHVARHTPHQLCLPSTYPSRAQQTVEFIRTYIQQHLDRPISIAELCRAACLSQSALFRLFRQELGLSPVQVILRERIRRAKQLLQHASISITDVCYESGFSSLSYFIRVFRRLTGKTPGQYREGIHQERSLSSCCSTNRD